MNIAIFDSGIGGLSVLYQARRMLPEAHFCTMPMRIMCLMAKNQRTNFNLH